MPTGPVNNVLPSGSLPPTTANEQQVGRVVTETAEPVTGSVDVSTANSQLDIAATDPLNVASRAAASNAAPTAGGKSSETAPWAIHSRRVNEATGELGWFRSYTFQRYLDELTHSHQVSGNSVELLVNGVASFARRLQNIAEADVVLLKTYNFRDDETGRQTRQALMERARAGAKVFVQFDVKGYTKNALQLIKDGIFNSYELPPELQEMQRAGVMLIPTNPDSANPIFDKDHEKYLITWKAGGSLKLIMGGMNVGNEWAYGGNPDARVEALHGAHGFRDTDAEIKGPIIEDVLAEYIFDASNALAENRKLDHPVYVASGHAHLREVQDQLLAAPGALAKAGEARMRFVANRPEGGAYTQYIEKLYLAMMEKVPAGETVTYVNPLFLPTDELIDGIKTATERGVHFVGLFNPPEAAEPGQRLVARAAQSLYREVYKTRSPETLEIFEWLGDPSRGVSSLHHKLARWGTKGPFAIGSSNLDFHSLRHNTEGVMLIDDPTAGERFNEEFLHDMMSGKVRRVTPETLQRQRMLSRLRSSVDRQMRRWI